MPVPHRAHPVYSRIAASSDNCKCVTRNSRSTHEAHAQRSDWCGDSGCRETTCSCRSVNIESVTLSTAQPSQQKGSEKSAISQTQSIYRAPLARRCFGRT